MQKESKNKKTLFYMTPPAPIYAEGQEIPMTVPHSSRQANKLVSGTAAPAHSYRGL